MALKFSTVIAGFVVVALFLTDHAAANGDETVTQRELIVLAAPRSDDPYYRDVADDILAFHAAFAEAIIENGDDVLIFVDEAAFKRYADKIPKDRLVVAPMDDIWMRDFSLANPQAPVMFRYTAEGQGGGRRGQRDADTVQERLAAFLEEAGLDFAESDLLNDGGNFVDDYAGRAVVSRKFLQDNTLTEGEARARLREAARVDHIAFIEADEQGGLEHADGVVAFVGPNRIAVNAYPDDPAYAAALAGDLRAGLPGVEIFEIPAPYDGTQVHDERFGSACGLYTNMLVTPARIYFPQFGVAEDAAAIDALSPWTDKTIVPVPSGGVCHMGGGVRCMSWQLRGENAEKLLRWAAGRQ